MLIKGKERNLIFYDFEVFSHSKMKDNHSFWLVVLINYETKEKTVIVHNRAELIEFYNLHKDDIFIGYNNKNYDRWVFWGLLLDDDAGRISKAIVEDGKQPFRVLNKAYKKFPFYNYDIADILHSLKQYEGFLGHMIKESDIPFDLDRALTEEEINETIFYCTHDVEETIEVFEHKKGDFMAQKLLIEMYDGLSCDDFVKTKAQLTAFVLGGIKQSRIDDEFDFVFPYSLKLNKYKYIKEWFDNPRNKTYGRQLTTTVANGLEVTIGYGGIHGALPNTVLTNKIICHCDVASLYPSLMIVYDFLSRNVLDKNKFAEIKAERIKLKHAHDERQQPLKIVLNSTYGILKDKNSTLCDPRQSNNVCISGQLLMLDLLEKIEHLGFVYQMNTDAINIAFDTQEQFDEAKKIAGEWEKRTGLDLEWDVYSAFYQRDVNNYIAFEDNGKVESKGCMKQKKGLDYDLPIITKSIIEYFKNGTPIEEYINNENRLIEYQKITKASGLYQCSWYGTIKEMTENIQGKDKKYAVCDKGYKILEKVNRVFASKDENDMGMFKVKNEKKVEKIAGTPDRCFIDNDNIIDKMAPDKLNKQWYIDLANKTLADFISDSSKEIKDSITTQLLNIVHKNHETFYDVLEDIKLNTKVNKTHLPKYIKIDAFHKYGKANKLLTYYQYFQLFYNKKSMTNASLTKNKINDENIISLLKKHSEYNGDKGKYNKLASKGLLLDIFNMIPDTDIHIADKISQEFDLFDDCSSKDPNIDARIGFIMAVNDTHNPSVIIYNLKYGVTIFAKIPKQTFTTLALQPTDFILVKKTEQKPKVKVLGKDSKGINIIGADESATESWITQYEVIKRTFKKENSLLDE